ncbi:MAG: ABC transporter ATP-binding protein [Bacillota bacterium]
MSTLISVRGLCKVYSTGSIQVKALDDVSIKIDEGEFVAVMGPSGSGKSTLMNLLGCLDVPTSGSYELDGTEIVGLNEDRLAKVRNREIGFVFQNYNLIPKLTALQNVEAPLIYRKVPRAKRHELASAALESVGLADRARHRPSELSGGQQQRVAIARAIVTRPRILLADEPTGNLDSKSGEEVMALFQEINRAGNTIILITHSEDIAKRCKRLIRMLDGRVLEDAPVVRQAEATAI